MLVAERVGMFLEQFTHESNQQNLAVMVDGDVSRITLGGN
jgi:hypothetical protein